MAQKITKDEVIWTRRGDCREEGNRLIEKSLRENGKLVGNPSVMFRKYSTGLFTILAASHPWWDAEMKQHPDWQCAGPGDEELLDILDESGSKVD